MLTVILFATIGVVLGVGTSFTEYGDITISGRIFSGFMGGLLLGCLGVIAGILLSLLPWFAKGTTSTDYSLMQIGDSRSTSGSFFLGSGIISDSQVFTFYKNENGVITLSQADAGMSQIQYTEGKPTVTVTRQACTSRWALQAGCSERTNTYVFHIPTGSVQNSYTLPSK